MALAIDASTPAKATGTGTAITTASFTPPAGALIAILYGANNPLAGQDTSISSITNTGTAVTWSRLARKNNNTASIGGKGTDGGAEIWTGVAPGGAISVTVNGLSSGAGFEKLVRALVLTSADTTTLSNVGASSATSGLPSVTLSGCSAGSYVLAVSSDWNQAGLGTAGTGQTITDEYNVSGETTLHAWRTTSTLASPGSQTMNLTAPSGQQYNLVALEVKASTGGGSAFSGSVALSGSGTLTASGKATTSGSLALSGSGTLTASGTGTTSGSVSLTGSGALTASGSAATSGSTSLSGSGSLTATGSPAASGTVALSGSGTLSASGTKSGGTAYSGSLALSGSGTLTASGKINAAGALALSGSGSLAVTGTSKQTGTLALSGSGTLAYSAAINAAGTLALTGEGVLTASGFNPAHLRDLSATAVLLPPRMSAELSPARLAAVLEPARMTATLEAP